MSNYPPMPPYSSPYSVPGNPGMPPAVPKGPREYSIFGAMIRAPFFNANVYRDVARNWSGIGFLYLFLLLLITWIIVLVKIHFAVTAFARNDFPALVKDVPPITVQGGHVSSPVQQPYFIKDAQGNKTYAVIDTTGKINSMDDTDAQFLITDHKIWSRQNKGEIREFDVPQIKYFYLDKAKLIAWMDGASQWLAILAFFVFMILSLIFRLIQALMYGGLCIAFSGGFRANLNYAAAMRLAVVSVTPVIVIDTILRVTWIHIPLWPLLGIGISVLYMVMAVKANADPNPPAPGGFPTSPPPGGYV